MKKILSLGLVLLLLSVAASAQARPGERTRRAQIQRNFNQLTRPERFELRKDATRYHSMERRTRRDGVVSPRERRRLHKAKRIGRVDRFRFRHNGRHRRI